MFGDIKEHWGSYAKESNSKPPPLTSCLESSMKNPSPKWILFCNVCCRPWSEIEDYSAVFLPVFSSCNRQDANLNGTSKRDIHTLLSYTLSKKFMFFKKLAMSQMLAKWCLFGWLFTGSAWIISRKGNRFLYSDFQYLKESQSSLQTPSSTLNRHLVRSLKKKSEVLRSCLFIIYL